MYKAYKIIINNMYLFNLHSMYIIIKLLKINKLIINSTSNRINKSLKKSQISNNPINKLATSNYKVIKKDKDKFN